MPRILPLLLALLLLPTQGAAAPVSASEPPPVIDPNTKLPWRYTFAFGFEVYSSMSDELTTAYLDRLYRSLPAPGLPSNFRTGRSLPIQLILHLSFPEPELVGKDGIPLLRDFARSDNTVTYIEASDADIEWIRGRVGGINFRLLDHYGMVDLPFYLMPYQVQRSYPEVPAWLLAGIRQSWEQPGSRISFIAEAMKHWRQIDTLVPLKDAARHPERLIPLARFFNELPPAVGTPEYTRWIAQAELLVRWGCDGEEGRNRASFWKVVERACAGPITEDVIRGAFRVGFAQIEARLANYLGALEPDLTYYPDQSLSVPSFVLRNASAAEVARVEAEWAEATAAEIKPAQPENAARLQAYAEKRLLTAVQIEERDPRVLAALGLHYLDQGETAKARPLLEEASERDALRPRAHLEWGRLLLNESKAASNASLTNAQVRVALKPLLKARALPSPAKKVYATLTELWEATAMKPSLELFAVVVEGTEHYPRDAELALRVARLGKRYGYLKESTAVLDRALLFPTREEQQQLLRELHSQLARVDGK